MKAVNTSGTWNNNVYSKNGINFTVNNDGTIIANGTAEGNATIQYNNFTLALNNDKLSGCPSGGSASTYEIQFNVNSDWGNIDYGNGKEVSGNVAGAVIVVRNSTVCNNLTFKPMITLAEQPNSDYAHYVPYAMTNRELTDNVGVKNVTITPETGVTIDYNSCHKIGNLVILNFRFILDASFSVVADVPIARIDTLPLDDAVLAEASTAWDGSVGGIVTILKRTNIIKLAAVGNFAAGKSYVVNVAYVCA